MGWGGVWWSRRQSEESPGLRRGEREGQHHRMPQTDWRYFYWAPRRGPGCNYTTHTHSHTHSCMHTLDRLRKVPRLLDSVSLSHYSFMSAMTSSITHLNSLRITLTSGFWEVTWNRDTWYIDRMPGNRANNRKYIQKARTSYELYNHMWTNCRTCSFEKLSKRCSCKDFPSFSSILSPDKNIDIGRLQ